ncbi:MAG: NUDIX domain-containing protein [Clostridia bacterium]|nr:NUDIX domain-containing protein [Clostridia bacterium]
MNNMQTETIIQKGRVYSDPPERIRPASRGLIICDNKILLTYETETDVYMTPGGGVETGETLEECCVRELREEAGIEVKVIKPFITVNEYSFETLYISNYFLCEIVGKSQQSLTDIEIEHGAVPRWIQMEKAIEIFSHYKEKREDVMSLYLREYTVLNRLRGAI